MQSNFRVLETNKGFLAQERFIKSNFWGKKYDVWECCIFWFGTKEPFYFSTKESALRELLKDLKYQILNESYK